jgi:predicted membrane protein
VFFGEVVLGIIGLVLLLIGLFSFVVAYGFWNGLGWAWTIGIILNILGVLSNLASLPGGIFGLLLNGLILYYLTRPHVKRYFGKEPKTFTI